MYFHICQKHKPGEIFGHCKGNLLQTDEHQDGMMEMQVTWKVPEHLKGTEAIQYQLMLSMREGHPKFPDLITVT